MHSDLFVEVTICRRGFILLAHGLAGHTILAFNPTAEIYKLTSFRTEGTERIVFPFDWLTAGWAFHES
jgi:hypothetical protein